MQHQDNTSFETRRSFLKKAAYAAPAVIALGSLSAPVTAHASIIYNHGTFTSGTKSFDATESYDNVRNVSVSGTLDYGTTHKDYVETDFATNEGLLQKFFNFLFR